MEAIYMNHDTSFRPKESTWRTKQVYILSMSPWLPHHCPTSLSHTHASAHILQAEPILNRRKKSCLCILQSIPDENVSSSGQAAKAISKEKIHVKTQIGATQSFPLFFLENTKQQLFPILEASMSNLSCIWNPLHVDHASQMNNPAKP